jgi:predicted nucleic acid-binding Zn ribbon protein
MAMKSLGELLKKQMPQKQIGKQVEATIVVEKTNQILAELFDPHVIKFAQAIYYKDKVIAIACLSSVMAQEIRLHEQKIIDYTNNKLGINAIEKIRFLL